MERPTDEQLREWLYDAEFDHAAVDGDHDFDANPLPLNTFPKYYAEDYNPTLAVLFRELLALRASMSSVDSLTEIIARGVMTPNEVHRVIEGEPSPI
ncbi:hypothetical protein [Nocardia sp. NBC_01327]|uniref:hypothetical protein n=1 Tax=Nocardia sp. NBC_01327 TaxID=2903593 RepID=UPI002E0D3F3D|nr:hypothetical protein OG326_23715 [Nocardia sp. NBC_01327]